MDLTIKSMAVFSFIEPVVHYYSGTPGSPLQRASYCVYYLIWLLIVKYFLIKYPRQLEAHAAFMISGAQMIIVTERGFFMSPDTYQFSAP